MDRWSALDRIVRVEPGREAVAIRNVPNTLAILDSHFPRFPVLPGVLILASLGRLGALLLGEGGGRAWRLAEAEGVRYRHYARPGDQLELRVEVVTASDAEAVLTGSVRVGDRTVTAARRLRFRTPG